MESPSEHVLWESSDYRISPFELESMLLEHPSVAEGAVVPAPQALRTSIPRRLSASLRDVSRTRHRLSRFLSTQDFAALRSSGCEDCNFVICPQRRPEKSSPLN